MCVKEQIMQATDQVFENAWQKERARLSEILERYKQGESVPNRECYAVTGDKTRNFNNVDRKTYKLILSLRSLMGMSVRKGIDEALQQVESTYKEVLKGKLQDSLNKHTFNCDATEIDVSNTPQGYCVVAKLENGSVFETRCIGVGGYNIVSFHYRYTHKLRK